MCDGRGAASDTFSVASLCGVPKGAPFEAVATSTVLADPGESRR